MGITTHSAKAHSAGFTIVELIVVVSVMAILLVLGVVSLSSTQVQARDKTRESNMQTFAQNLERYFTNGDADRNVHGSYPTEGILNNETSYLPDLARKILFDPNSTADPNDPGATTSLTTATTNNQTVGGILPLPSATNYIYVYQPLTSTNARCTTAGACVKYNLYYYQESSGTVVKVTSRRQ